MLRSSTRRSVSFSRLRSWLGESAWSTRITSAAVLRGELFQLARLAAAHEITRIGARAPSGEGGDRHGPCGHGELGELLQVLRIHGSAQSQAHQYGTLTSPWAFEHSGFP